MCKNLCRLVAWGAIAASPVLKLWSRENTPQSVLSVQVYNVAQVNSLDLAAAERLAAAIFARAGIATNWKDASATGNEELSMDFSAGPGSARSCTDGIERAEIKLQLISSTPTVTMPGALAFALPCARFGVSVTIFADRCEEVSGRNWAPLPQLLGYVMAHEVGHLLLGPDSHADEGIMRARWAAGQLAFSPWQAERMRRRRNPLVGQAIVFRGLSSVAQQIVSETSAVHEGRRLTKFNFKRKRDSL